MMRGRTIRLPAVLLVAGATIIGSSAEAAPILGAVGVVASNSFPDPTYGTPQNLINQGGLAVPYVSGVTDFDAYIAGNPQHTILSAGAEWFTDFGQPGATLIFDMGAVVGLDRVALWNDEFWGAGNVAVALSTDNVIYTGVGGFIPTDWPGNVNSYGANVFGFAAMQARYVRLTLSNCPQANGDPNGGCGLGEVAFRQADVAPIPEPLSLSLLGSGLAALAASRRRRAR